MVTVKSVVTCPKCSKEKDVEICIKGLSEVYGHLVCCATSDGGCGTRFAVMMDIQVTYECIQYRDFYR